MEENNCLPSPYLGKKFGYIDIEWTIENFCLQICEKKAEIQSPEFTGWDGTKFVLIIKSVQKVDGDEPTLWLFIKRSESDTGPNQILVNWRLEMYGANYVQKVALDDTLDSFEKGSEKVKYIINKEDLIDNMLKDVQDAIGPDTLNVECKMLSYSEDVKGDFECSDRGLALLSKNLSYIYESGIGSDISLASGSSTIPCHKEILCARNEVFRDLILKSETKGPTELEEIFLGEKFEIMKRIIGYIYTGNLKYIFEKPSLSVVDCAALCDIMEITDYYSTDSLMFHSSSDVQELSFTWKIKDYKNLFDYHESTVSPFVEDSSHRSWQLHLHAGPKKGRTGFAFYLRSVQKITALSAYLEFHVENAYICYCRKNKLLSDLDCSKKFGFSDAFSKSELPRANDLTLVVKLKFYTGTDNPIPVFGRHTIQSVTCSTDKSYQKLSDDLNKMLQEGAFQDFCEEYENYNIRAHKYFVDTRCSVFCDLVREPEKTVQASILEFVLSYIYSGVMPNVESDLDLIKVYKAAKTFELTDLKEACSELLRDRVKKDARLMYEILYAADQSEDEALKSEFRKRILKANNKN